MQFEHRFVGADPRALGAEFATPDFLRALAVQMPVTDRGAQLRPEGELVTTVLNWRLDTSDVPAPFNRLLPGVVELQWSSGWWPGGSPAPTTVWASAQDPQVRFDGQQRLVSSGGPAAGTLWQVEGELSGRARGMVPARVLKTALAAVLRNVLRDEAKLMEQRLGLPAQT